MSTNPIQWFPGHMAKTRRVIKECLPDVDFVMEVLDARIPYSSHNPDLSSLLGTKPRVVLLTKASLADESATNGWITALRAGEMPAVAVDTVTGYGMRTLTAEVGHVMREKLERYKNRGMEGKALRAMVVGIPNVGKSSLINRLAGGKRAKVENRPGVTLTKQWVTTDDGLFLLDMPGVLWPKFEDPTVGENLAVTGAIRDSILDTEELAMVLCTRLFDVAHDMFLARYRLTDDEVAGLDGYDLLTLVGRKRGFLVSGGEVNLERTAGMLLDEFRNAKIGRITLEAPKDKAGDF